jgi:hypothetical protein
MFVLMLPVQFSWHALLDNVFILAIPCPFFVGWVKRQRNPTLMLGYGYGSYVATQAIATLRERTSTQPTSQDFF